MTDTPLTEQSFYILVALAQPLHGYGVIKKVEAMSNARVVLGPGTLYGALNALKKKGWIQPADAPQGDDRRKGYVITPEGQTVLKADLARMEELVAHGRAVIETWERADAAE
ncbi:MAG: PadR family transcriptional regulator [Maricaulaceae bacterium]